MSSKRAPGPWEVIKSSKPQAAGDWIIARNVSVRPSFSHYEQMRDAEGEIIRFATEQHARVAIASTTGSAA